MKPKALLLLLLAGCSYRSIGTIIDDNAQEMAIRSRLFANKRINDNSNITVTMYNGRVLLTGEVRDQQIATEAVQVVQMNGNVREIRNFLVVGPMSTFSERSYDAGQTAKIKAALMDIKMSGFNTTNIKVVTEHGTSYLMGIVTRSQAQAVSDKARQVTGARSIITLFDLYNGQ